MVCYLCSVELTDTHTHLFLEHFKDDIETVIGAAHQAGITRFFLPNIDSSTTESMLHLEQQFPDTCYAMMGLHPCSVSENYQEELAHVRLWHSKRKFVAVGEIGIDLHWDKTFLKEQKDAFKDQLVLAKELALPIVIHVRNSFNEVFEIVDELNDDSLYGIFHCFSGTLEQANKIIAYGGFKLGIGGVLTFKNSGLDEVIKSVELENLVLETDSPYLTPTPHRGQRNESKYVLNVAKKLAEVQEIELEEVARVTTANAKQIYKWDD